MKEKFKETGGVDKAVHSHHEGQQEYPLEFSVVMPCLNEEAYIRGAIGSLLNDDFRDRGELIVVDGMSSDRTREIVKEFMGKGKEKEKRWEEGSKEWKQKDKNEGEEVREGNYVREEVNKQVKKRADGGRVLVEAEREEEEGEEWKEERKVGRERREGGERGAGEKDEKGDSERGEESGSSYQIRLIDNPYKTQAWGLNLGIKAARGKYILRADAHCVYPPGYIRDCIRLLQETGAEAAGGMMWPQAKPAREGRRKVVQEAIALALRHPVGVGNARWHLGNYQGYAEATYVGAFPWWVFDKVGLYDTNCQANQDGELYLRIMRAGGKIYLDSSIKVIYFPRQTLRALARQYWRYGQGRAYTTWKHRRFSSWRQGAAPVLVVGLVGSVALAVASGQWWWLLGPLVYVGGLVTGAMVSRWSAPGRHEEQLERNEKQLGQEGAWKKRLEQEGQEEGKSHGEEGQKETPCQGKQEQEQILSPTEQKQEGERQEIVGQGEQSVPWQLEKEQEWPQRQKRHEEKWTQRHHKQEENYNILFARGEEQRRRISLKTRFLVASAWAIMHVTWGTGFLYNFTRLVLSSVFKKNPG